MNINIPSQVQLGAYYLFVYALLYPYLGETTNIIISLFGSMTFFGISKLLKLRGKSPSIRKRKGSISKISDINLYAKSDEVLEFEMGYNEMEVMK